MAMDGPGRVDHSSQSHTSAVPSTQPAKTSGFKDGVKVDVVESPERHVGTQEKPDNFNPRKIHDRFPRKLTRKESFKLSLLQLGLSLLWGKAKTHVVDKALNMLSQASTFDNTALGSKVEQLLEAKKSSLSNVQAFLLENARDRFVRNEKDEAFPDDDDMLAYGHLSFEGVGSGEAARLEFTPFEPSALDAIQDLYDQGDSVQALSLLAGKIVDYSDKTISARQLDELCIAEGVRREDLLESFAELLTSVIEDIPHPKVSLESYLSMAQSAQAMHPDNATISETVEFINEQIQA